MHIVIPSSEIPSLFAISICNMQHLRVAMFDILPEFIAFRYLKIYRGIIEMQISIRFYQDLSRDRSCP